MTDRPTSENQPISSDDERWFGLVADFDKAIRDPEPVRIVGWAKEIYAQWAQSSDDGVSSREQLVGSLNQLWTDRGYMGGIMSATGWSTPLTVTERGLTVDGSGKEHSTKEDISLLGFAIAPTEPSGQESLVIVGEHKDPASSSYGDKLIIDLDSYIEFNSVYSLEYVQAVMKCYLPQATQAIDEALISANSMECGSRLIALRGIDLSELSSLHSDNYDKVAGMCIRYIDNMVSLDTEAPQRITYRGKVPARDDYLQLNRALSMLQRVIISISMDGSGGENSHRLAVLTKVLGPTSQYDQYLALPIDSIQAIESMRPLL